MYEIEKGHSIPPRPKNKGIYPFRNMAPGDSFFVSSEKKQACQSSANGYAARHGDVKFRFSREGEGWRCFCIAADHEAS